jgi:hypothetical protein
MANVEGHRVQVGTGPTCGGSARRRIQGSRHHDRDPHPPHHARQRRRLCGAIRRARVGHCQAGGTEPGAAARYGNRRRLRGVPSPAARGAGLLGPKQRRDDAARRRCLRAERSGGGTGGDLFAGLAQGAGGITLGPRCRGHSRFSRRLGRRGVAGGAASRAGGDPAFHRPAPDTAGALSPRARPAAQHHRPGGHGIAPAGSPAHGLPHRHRRLAPHRHRRGPACSQLLAQAGGTLLIQLIPILQPGTRS